MQLPKKRTRIDLCTDCITTPPHTISAIMLSFEPVRTEINQSALARIQTNAIKLSQSLASLIFVNFFLFVHIVNKL